MSPVPDEFMTVAEVADVLKLNQQTVRNWIDSGRLPALRIGRRVRVRRVDFDELVEDGYGGARRQQPEPEFNAAMFWSGEVQPPPLASAWR